MIRNLSSSPTTQIVFYLNDVMECLSFIDGKLESLSKCKTDMGYFYQVMAYSMIDKFDTEYPLEEDWHLLGDTEVRPQGSKVRPQGSKVRP